MTALVIEMAYREIAERLTTLGKLGAYAIGRERERGMVLWLRKHLSKMDVKNY